MQHLVRFRLAGNEVPAQLPQIFLTENMGPATAHLTSAYETPCRISVQSESQSEQVPIVPCSMEDGAGTMLGKPELELQKVNVFASPAQFATFAILVHL